MKTRYSSLALFAICFLATSLELWAQPCNGVDIHFLPTTNPTDTTQPPTNTTEKDWIGYEAEEWLKMRAY